MRRSLLLLLGVVLLAGCIVNVRRLRVDPQQAPFTPVQTSTPVKAHLADGSTLVFPRGVNVTPTTLEGAGVRYDLHLAELGPVSSIPLDSVVAFESFRTGTNAAASIALSLLGTAGLAVGVTAAAVAVFGSCPTIYVDSAGVELLQGEAFSYSIAPLFESRDVDRIYGRPDAAGMVWIELRNEALETHYLNFMELLQVPHRAGERVLPDELGQPVATGTLTPPRSARDGAGRDVTATLAAADSAWFASAPALSARPEASGYRDYIELTYVLAEPRDSVALVLRLRNSLLNTVLFYDVMLGAAGARSIDWLGASLEDIGQATELGRWYAGLSGVRIAVQQADTFATIARVGDAGPIADKEVAVVLPAHGQRELRVRLEFLADSWRIDQAALAIDVSRPDERVVPVAVVTANGVRDTAAVSRLREPDDRYLMTLPGHALRIGFDVGARSEETTSHSYLLAAQGYYTEWIRRDWVRAASSTETFTPGNAALDATYARWREVRDEFETQFYARRVPVGRP